MAFLVRLTALTFFLIVSFPSFSQDCDCVTTGNCPVPINDNGTYNGVLDVTVNGQNDLAENPLTSVCFTITHTWIGDLSVSLTSPSGVNYILMADVNNNYGGCGMQQDNLDVCIVLGDNNPLTNNTEYICNSAPCPAGTCCLTGDWTVACGGVEDPINGAEQSPNCDLNDFNVPGDPANGTWTLTVVDVCNMDTGTLDNFSLNFENGVESCIVCSADGGLLDSIEVTSCFGDDDDLYFDFAPNYSGEIPDSNYNYGYIISQNGVVLDVDTVADLTMQPTGVYHVHGFSYLISDSLEISSVIGLDTGTVIGQLTSATAPFCADLSDNFVPVTIMPAIPVTDVNATVCEGECIMVGSQQVCFSGTIILNSVYGCDSILNITINEISANAIIDPPAPPSITCSSTSVNLDGSGSSGDTYNWVGPNGFMGDQPSVTVTEPGTYSLIVSNTMIDPPCESTTTVMIADGRVFPEITIDNITPQICDGEAFDLASLTIQDQNNTSPIITFHSGTPAMPANELSGTTVNPTNTTTYYVLATNGSCTDEESIVLIVNDVPTANFSANNSICTTDESTITYLGDALPISTYNWDFDGGVAVPGTGPGPHTVTWINQGNYTVSLTVEENGCLSTLFTQDVSVEDPLPPPTVDCSNTTSTITFSWEDVFGATDYLVTVLDSPNGNDGTFGIDPNTYIFDNLNPGNSATIEVVAIGAGICGNSSTQYTCTANDCPDVNVEIDPVPLVCIDNSTTSFNLSAQATGGVGNGDFIWSGDGVTISGNFDPELVPLGTTTVTVDYYEDNCIYPGTSIDIDVYETPLVAINVPFYICSGEPVPVSFAGIAEPNSTYTWNFEGGTILSGSGEGPYEVIWPIGGEYDITLTVEGSTGCVSETLVQPTILLTPLNDPDITCDVTPSTITFSWPIDPEASSYSVDFPNGLIIQDQSNSTHRIFHIINLNPGDVVPIEVAAIGAIPCGNAIFETFCEVPACPDVILDIEPVADICQNPSLTPFNLNATITGGAGNGVATWNGTGVDPDGMFDPDQADIGANNITLTYEEGLCFYTQSIVINVFETPTPEFSAVAAICAGDVIDVAYTGINDSTLIYTWDFAGGNIATTDGAGPHPISWPIADTYTISLIVENENGCISEENTFDILVEEPLQEPSIYCSSTTNSISFSWNSVGGITDSIMNVSVPQTGTLQGTVYTLDGLQPETSVDFDLTLIGGGNCPPVIASYTCTTDACPDINLDVESVSGLCLGLSAPIQLNPIIMGSDGSGIGTWNGDGVNSNSGMFDPNAAGEGTHNITYIFEELGCSFGSEVEINVYQPPVASFSTDALICISDAATVTFDGSAGSNAIFNWDFDGGVPISGSGPGPYSILWGTPGIKNIILEIIDNGCPSNQFQQQVQVDEEFEMPSVDCNATTESVEFIWSDITGTTGYQIEIISQGTGSTTITSPSYLINGLDPEENVTIQITPLVNTSCDVDPVIVSCSAAPCDEVDLAIEQVAPICLMPTTQNVALQVDVSGPMGIGEWTGTGITNPSSGVFDPNLAGEGLHTVIFSYQVINCTYTDEIEIKVGAPPIADAGEDATLTCWENEQTALLGGSGTSTGQNVLFEWTTQDGSLPDNPTILRPEINVAGTYLLTVTDVELGCSDSDEVVVTSTQDFPIPTVSFAPSDCDGLNTTVIVEQVVGGMAPYLFSLSGEPYIEEDTFAFLPSGIYDLSVIDVVGCESDTTFEVDQALGSMQIDLTANLVGRNYIEEGESIQLIALSNFSLAQLDSIVWSNPELLSCTNCLNPIAAPTEETTFMVTAYFNGCEVSDELTIHVGYKSPIYVPNAFSPNVDGTNDIFRIYAGPRVSQIKSIMIFDRWGEIVYIQHDYDPNDPKIGWDGTLDGKPMNPAVFVWYVEVELVDGASEVLEGSLNLIR